MNAFDDWHKELISDYQWYSLLRMYKEETIKKAAEKVFAENVADGVVITRPMSENRKHVYRVCIKNNPVGDKPIEKNWYVKEQEKKEAEEKITETYTPEFAAMKKKEALDIIAKSEIINRFPKVSYKQSVEEGDWIPKKPAPYPSTSRMEYYLRQRHIEYIKQNYDARTAQPLPGWRDEHTFNLIYDYLQVNPKASEEEIEAYISKFNSI